MLYCIIRYCILALAYTRPALELLLTLPGPRRPTSLCKTEVHRRVAIIMILIIIMIIISISIVVSRSLFGCILSLLSPVLACCQSSSYYMKCPFTLVKDRRFINLRRLLRDKRCDHWFMRTGCAQASCHIILSKLWTVPHEGLVRDMSCTLPFFLRTYILQVWSSMRFLSETWHERDDRSRPGHQNIALPKRGSRLGSSRLLDVAHEQAASETASRRLSSLTGGGWQCIAASLQRGARSDYRLPFA